MARPISKELRELLESAPKITRKIEAFYDPISFRTHALITITVNGETITAETDICYVAPIIDITDVWIDGIHVPAEDIAFHAATGKE